MTYYTRWISNEILFLLRKMQLLPETRNVQFIPKIPASAERGTIELGITDAVSVAVGKRMYGKELKLCPNIKFILKTDSG